MPAFTKTRSVLAIAREWRKWAAEERARADVRYTPTIEQLKAIELFLNAEDDRGYEYHLNRALEDIRDAIDEMTNITGIPGETV